MSPTEEVSAREVSDGAGSSDRESTEPPPREEVEAMACVDSSPSG